MASGGTRRTTFLATPAFQTSREELREEQQAEFLTECWDTPSPRGPSAGLCGEVTCEDASEHGPDHLPRLCQALHSLPEKVLPTDLRDRNCPHYTEKLRLRGLK